MWLRLTDANTSKIKLVNMDRVTYITNSSMHSGAWLEVDDNYYIDVKESIDEIEIKLAGKGAEVRRADPRERSWIGCEIEQGGDL